jgi:phytoene dehydrogenase-like protein
VSRPVIIGGGHNGLVAAAYLARAGHKPLVLERRDEVGGAAVTHELTPGFRVPALAHATALRADIVSQLSLENQGLHFTRPPVSVFAPAGDGRALVLWREMLQSVQSLAQWSAADAARWPEFSDTALAIAGAIGGLLRQVPPSLDEPGPGELWDLVSTGRAIRGLGRSRLYQMLRWGPMPIADLAAEWLESPVARAVICGRGIFAAAAGPRSAGTAASWLLQVAHEGHPAGAPTFVAGGPGSLAAAIAAAATGAGAEIRRNAEVAHIDVDDRGVCGVTLASGEQIRTGVVISNADPKRTLLDLVDPVRLPPSFRHKIQHYRMRGVLAKVNLALARLPKFRGAAAHEQPSETLLAGRIHIGPDPDYLERAFDRSKYGELSTEPWLEVVIPSLTDPTLAPQGQHVMSVYAQWAPYALRGQSWNRARDAFSDAIVKTIAAHAPDLPSLILAREILTPLDLEQRYGLTGGHIFHGEHALDQLYAMRPVLGWAQHRTPIAGLYLCGAGTHPGGGLTGAPGAHAARIVLKDPHRTT